MVTTALSAEEEARLVALLEKPTPPRRAPPIDTRKAHMRAFLRDYEVAPGRAIGIEVCSLYRLYRQWLAGLTGAPEALTPKMFATYLKREGFRRLGRKAFYKYDINRYQLGMRKDVAERLTAWFLKNPDSPADRVLFAPARMRNARQ